MSMTMWYKSKMLWLALATLITAIGDAVTSGMSWENGAMAVIAAMIAFLRTQTIGPLTTSEPKPPPNKLPKLT
jgi:hypothetical protein